MANPSFSIPDELLEEFDRQISKKEAAGELPLNTGRSEVVRELMRGWAEGKSNSPRDSGRKTAKPTAD